MKVADCSFAYFVYPFVFDSHRASERIEAFKEALFDGKPIWIEQQFPADDLMPHVADFVNPRDTCATGTAVPTACLWKLNESMQNVYGMARSAEWTLHAKNTIDIPFQLGEIGNNQFAVHLALFCSGVGFLTFQARPKSEDLDVWLDFLHYFRIGDGKRAVCVEARKRTGKDTSVPFFPEPAGGVSQLPDDEGTLQKLWQTLLRTSSVDDGKADWWKDVFVTGRTLPYVCLYVEDMHDEPECARLLYRLRNFFRSGQEIVPCSADLRLDHSALVEYAQRQWFVFSLEGSVFVACDAPRTDFFRETLPQHVRREYFLIFLLALQQRFTLIQLSNEVASKWHLNADAQDTRETDFGIIRDSLLQFTARGYFAQVMQREHHHRCYVKWLEIFQIERLYSEVRDEVQDMHDWILLQQNRRQEEQAEQSTRATTGLTKVASLLGPPGLTLTACQALAITNPHIVGPAAFAAFALGGSIVGLLNHKSRTHKQHHVQKPHFPLSPSLHKPTGSRTMKAISPPKQD